MTRITRFCLLAAFALALPAAGCWPQDDPRGDAGKRNGALTPEVSSGQPIWKGGRGIVVLDPLDWSIKYFEARGLKPEHRDGAVRLPLDDAERTADALAGAILALRRRMAVIAENVANAETSRMPGAEAGAPPVPYRRKVLTVAASGALEVVADNSAFRKVYRPGHPDADKDGRVQLPNVYVAVEMADWRASAREYETLRDALALVSGRYAAPPAELLPAPVPPPPYEEKPATTAPVPPVPEPKPVAPPTPAPKAG